MGLFIGAGLLTLVQLLEYFLDEILTLCGVTRDNERDEMKVFFGCVKNNKTDDSSKLSSEEEKNDNGVAMAWSTA